MPTPHPLPLHPPVPAPSARPCHKRQTDSVREDTLSRSRSHTCPRTHPIAVPVLGPPTITTPASPLGQRIGQADPLPPSVDIKSPPSSSFVFSASSPSVFCYSPSHKILSTPVSQVSNRQHPT